MGKSLLHSDLSVFVHRMKLICGVESTFASLLSNLVAKQPFYARAVASFSLSRTNGDGMHYDGTRKNG